MISRYYQGKLSTLNVDRSSGHPKPHKVCLLLSVLGLVSSGKVTKNEFVIDDALKREFSRNFNQLKKGNDSDKINQPFYHLLTDGIWHFKLRRGEQVRFAALKSKSTTPSVKAINELIEYAYLDEEIFGYFKNELTRDPIKHLLLENLEDLSEQFDRWLQGMGTSRENAQLYVEAIRGKLSIYAADSGASQANLISILSYEKIHHVAEKLASYEVFRQTNDTENGLYRRSLDSYQRFLSDICQVEVSEDIQKIINDSSISNTEKSRLVNTRVGQGRFREELVKYWKTCALTRYADTQFLVASHIKPWRKSEHHERLDPYNGLLLLPNLDKAFDLGYISFEEKGKIKISGLIDQPEKLGIKRSMRIDLARQHQEYMAYHREIEFKN